MFERHFVKPHNANISILLTLASPWSLASSLFKTGILGVEELNEER